MSNKQANVIGWLSDDTFRQVVAHAPLVSLDFIVTNTCGEWLLGQRTNRPAQGYWFVPGGRVRKCEELDAAARRLTQEELGRASELSDMRFLGVFQHFYTDSMFGREISTHYLVLAYQLQLELELDIVPRQQHLGYRWWSPHAISTDDMVHSNTRAYLTSVPT